MVSKKIFPAVFCLVASLARAPGADASPTWTLALNGHVGRFDAGTGALVDADAAGRAFDGDWSVLLVCADTQDHGTLVKGYEFTFLAHIADGKLSGQYGAKGAPASLVYAGTVEPDGTLEIRATGNTGLSDRTVGRVAQGTPYTYTLTGKLGAASGQATRRELRPCTAAFTRR